MPNYKNAKSPVSLEDRLRALQPGQSFFRPTGAARDASYIYAVANRCGLKVSTKLVEKDGEPVWEVSLR